VNALFALDSLHVSYGKAEVLRGVCLRLNAGGLVTVIGRNGAGKTTMLNAAMGLLPARGRVIFDGVDISQLEVEERCERGLCLVPEKRELFGEMSVIDNLRLGAWSRRDRGVDSDLADVFARFPRLAERRRQYANTLSGGERQMLTLGRALMMRPRVLMLDEPSLGLAPLIVREISRTIAALRATGVSILLVEQNARAALETADYGYVLETGEISAEGEARALLDDPKLIDSYLGEGSD
jgi:branched-chain amino acid transport system ATP-binding protein